MAHDIFISYAEEDRRLADAVCRVLEEVGVRCWYAPRDVPYTEDYEEAIIDAISASKLMVLILSAHSNSSAHVKREVQNAYKEESKVPVLPFQVENISLNKALRYYIGSVQLMSALTPPLDAHLKELVTYVQSRLPQHGVEKNLTKQNGQLAEPEVRAETEEDERRRAKESSPTLEAADAASRHATERRVLKTSLIIVSVATLLMALLFLIQWLIRRPTPQPVNQNATPKPANQNATPTLIQQAAQVRISPLLLTAAVNTTRAGELFSQGKYGEAEPYYREAVRLEPYIAAYHNNLGDNLYRLEKYAEAEVSYREATHLEPGNALYYFNLGMALYKQEKYTKAEQAYRESLRLNPFDAVALNSLGQVLYLQEQFTEAETKYGKAVSLDPSNAAYHYNLGEALSSQGKYDKAEIQYQKAVQLDPDNPSHQEALKRVQLLISVRSNLEKMERERR